MSRYAWPKAEIAAAAAKLIREGGESIQRALADWDYRGANREMRLLFIGLIELDPSFREYLARELSLDQTENAQAGKPPPR